MTGGQTALLLDDQVTEDRPVRNLDSPAERAELTVIYADREEAAAHEDWLKLLDEKSGGRCLWRKH
jgi:DNA polymerase-3 subunit epsilon